MTDYQSRFDAHIAEANSAVSNKTVELGEALPGMNPAHVRRLLANVSKILGRVDRKDIAHPEYLAATPISVPEKLINAVSGIKSSLDSGEVTSFVQNILPSLVDLESRLIKAVGVDAYKIKEIKNAQVRTLDQIVDRSSAIYRSAQKQAEEIEETRDTAIGILNDIKSSLGSANTDTQKVADIRKLADKLASGNASQNPLEKLVREARERIQEIESIKSQAESSRTSATAAGDLISDHEKSAASTLKSLEAANTRADQILLNATQAGLAGAYKQERDKLAKEQGRFAVIFYAIIGSIIVYAAIFLLPIFKQLLGLNGDKVSAEDSALLLFVRLAILSPAVWALVFTNKRFVYLETLQMDYAAKATTALAYSGYREEMAEDKALSKRLKDGLVARFLEHPSRLLGKKVETSTTKSGPDGVTWEQDIRSPEISPKEESEEG